MISETDHEIELTNSLKEPVRTLNAKLWQAYIRLTTERDKDYQAAENKDTKRQVMKHYTPLLKNTLDKINTLDCLRVKWGVPK